MTALSLLNAREKTINRRLMRTGDCRADVCCQTNCAGTPDQQNDVVLVKGWGAPKAIDFALHVVTAYIALASDDIRVQGRRDRS